MIAAFVILAGCQSLPTPALTPTRGLSGPTLEPSRTVLPLLPTEVPPDVILDGRSDPTAAALPRDSTLPPLAIGTVEAGGRQPVELAAPDGLLDGDLYQPGGPDRLPGVLLVGPNRLAWGDFPAQLAAAGFTVLVVDLRDPANLADFTLMLDALNTGVADPNRIAVIAEGAGTQLALPGCARDLRCDALVLLSPLGDPNGVPGLNPRPFFVAVSSDDGESFPLAGAFGALMAEPSVLHTLDNAGRGADMLRGGPDLGARIISWLQGVLG